MNSDRIVIVTGAAGGVGQVVVRRWLETGARVAAVDIGKELLARLPEHDRLAKFAGDLISPDGAEAVITEITDTQGVPDTVIHTVGGFAMSAIDSREAPEQWSKMLALNSTSAFNIYRAMVPGLKQRGGGWMVGISSRAALQPPAMMVGYAASKAALIALTQSLADELRNDGIHVNVILASTIDTPANRAEMGEQNAPKWVSPEDIADATLYLCSDAAKSVHGATLEVYGRS